ncbi:hypothetical protein FALCPG4_015813 [Fusarium falciforme]
MLSIPPRKNYAHSSKVNSLEELVTWAKKMGVKINGITPETLGNRTRFVATKDLKENETILEIPYELAHTIFSIDENIHKQFPTASVHCQLAIEVAENLHNREKKPWCFIDEFPQELKRNHPLFWPEEIQEKLPRQSQEQLFNVRQMFERDWFDKTLFDKTGLKHITRDKFLRAWIIVMTRKFFLKEGKMKVLREPDQLALLPLAEIFNHATTGCRFTELNDRCQFVTTIPYKMDEEVCFCYGAEVTNDELLATYGFLSDNDPNDHVLLDPVIWNRLSKETIISKRDTDEWESYKLNQDSSFCDSTESLLPQLGVSTRDQRLKFLTDCKEAYAINDRISESPVRYPLVKKRWQQIASIIDAGLASNADRD